MRRRKAAQAACAAFFIGVLVLGLLSGQSYARDKGRELLAAAAKGDIETVAKLLAAKADVNAADIAGRAALMMASLGGHAEVVRLLIAAGANVNTRDMYGYTALAMALEKNHTEVVNILKQAGAKR